MNYSSEPDIFAANLQRPAFLIWFALLLFPINKCPNVKLLAHRFINSPVNGEWIRFGSVARQSKWEYLWDIEHVATLQTIYET